MILERTSADLCSSLILSEKLYPHLLEIDRAEQERMDAMLPRMMEAAGVTEELKACDPMRWVGLMNTLKAQAEEIIFQELISAWDFRHKKGRDFADKWQIPALVLSVFQILWTPIFQRR